MTKTKKMANLGLYLALFGAVLVAVGGFFYNKYSGKSRTENHNEVIKKQEELGGKIDSSTEKTIDNINSLKESNIVEPVLHLLYNGGIKMVNSKHLIFTLTTEMAAAYNINITSCCVALHNDSLHMVGKGYLEFLSNAKIPYAGINNDLNTIVKDMYLTFSTKEIKAIQKLYFHLVGSYTDFSGKHKYTFDEIYYFSPNDNSHGQMNLSYEKEIRTFISTKL